MGVTWLISLSSIVAVHGLNGDAYSTWTSEKSNVCWLNQEDLLPRYVPSARVLTWGYNANVMSVKGRSTSADRVLQHAQTLIAQLVADREVCVSHCFSHLLDADRWLRIYLVGGTIRETNNLPLPFIRWYYCQEGMSETCYLLLHSRLRI